MFEADNVADDYADVKDVLEAHKILGAVTKGGLEASHRIDYWPSVSQSLGWVKSRGSPLRRIANWFVK